MSKKILLNIFIVLLLIFSTVFEVNVANAAKIDTLYYDGAYHQYTGRDVTLMLNGDEFELTEGLMPPVILEDRTMVPVREVFEALGGEVLWTHSERRVDINFGSKTITLWIDNKNAKVDGESITVDVPAKIINDKTMVPARFISEQAGLVVGWNPETYTVSITSPKSIVTNVEYSSIENIDCVVVTADLAISGYKYFMLEEPYRLILDVENCKFNFDTSIQNIDNNLISTIRFGEQGNNVNRVVLDLKEDTDYIVVPSKDKTKLYFAMASSFVIPGEEENNISGDIKDNQQNSGDIKLDDDDDKSEVIENNNSGDKTDKIENSNSGDKTSEIEGNNSGDNSEVIENNTSDYNSGDDNKGDTSKNDKDNKDDIQNIIIPDVYITSIKYSSVSKRVRIAYDGDIEYKHMFLTNPNRIVIDIENAELKTEGPKEINIKNNVITSIRFSQYDEDAVRIVLDLDEKVDYKINRRSSELQVSVTQPTYKNVTYKLNAANSQITLFNVDKDDISVSRSENKNKYTLKFSSEDFDCGEGEITPEDDFVESITISETKIVIYDTGNMVYTMRQSGNNVIITIKEKAEIDDSEKTVILIDAGHGGSDPGACNGKAQEKVFNLNISLMLYDLLSERDDVIVYMTRDDDTYLNREDRLEIATKINPDFIVSVHNNSLENKSYSGTMVLYYNNDTESQYGDATSKECAQIVLNKLLNALDTVNRGVVSRKDLHILSKTPCPSILCEISFISNDAELERLKTKSFQEDAAEAIYEGVVEILGIM